MGPTNRQPRKWSEVLELQIKYPGLPLDVYQYGTFKAPNDTRKGWNENITREEFVATFGNKKLQKEVFESPSNKAFGQFFLIVTMAAFIAGILITHAMGIPFVGTLIVVGIISWLFCVLPTASVNAKIKRNNGEFQHLYRKYERDLF